MSVYTIIIFVYHDIFLFTPIQLFHQILTWWPQIIIIVSMFSSMLKQLFRTNHQKHLVQNQKNFTGKSMTNAELGVFTPQ